MSNNLSIVALLTNLINKAPKTEITEFQDKKKIGTTIRFDPTLRHFLEIQSEHLGVSIQEFVSMTLKAVMTATVEPQASELDLMAVRFVAVFRSHGIAVADIPDLLPKDALKRSDILSRELLINKLDSTLLDNVSNLFGINIKWLKGHENKTYPNPSRWYKNIQSFAYKIALLSHENRDIRVLFIAERGLTYELLKEAREKGDEFLEVNIGVVVEIEKIVNGQSFRCYQVCEHERWNYPKVRYYLKAMMMFCQNAGITYDGMLYEADHFQQIISNNILIPEVINRNITIWHPDQLLWNDSRNLELSELEQIKSFYADQGIDKYAFAVKYPWKIKSWEPDMNGHINIEIDNKALTA